MICRHFFFRYSKREQVFYQHVSGDNINATSNPRFMHTFTVRLTFPVWIVHIYRHYIASFCMHEIMPYKVDLYLALLEYQYQHAGYNALRGWFVPLFFTLQLVKKGPTPLGQVDLIIDIPVSVTDGQNLLKLYPPKVRIILLLWFHEKIIFQKLKKYPVFTGRIIPIICRPISCISRSIASWAAGALR